MNMIFCVYCILLLLSSLFCNIGRAIQYFVSYGHYERFYIPKKSFKDVLCRLNAISASAFFRQRFIFKRIKVTLSCTDVFVS